MSEDIIAEYIKKQIDALSETINNQFNPTFLFDYLFPQSNNENMQRVTIEILPNNNIRSGEMNYVTLTNFFPENKVENISSNQFPYRDRKRDRIRDPLVRESFVNINDMIPNDVLSQMYFASLGVLGIYILYGLMKRSKMVPI